MTKPNILNRAFVYVPSRRQTVEHLKAVFARERKRLAAKTEAKQNVKPIRVAK